MQTPDRKTSGPQDIWTGKVCVNGASVFWWALKLVTCGIWMTLKKHNAELIRWRAAAAADSSRTLLQNKPLDTFSKFLLCQHCTPWRKLSKLNNYVFTILIRVFLRLQTISKHAYTYSGFPVTEQVRLSESPSRKMPEGGTILTDGATVGRQKQMPVGEWWTSVKKIQTLHKK